MSWGNGHILRVLRYCKQGFVNYGPWVRFDPLLVFKQTTIRTVFTFLNHWLGSIVWQRPYVVCKAYNSYCLAFYKTSVLPTNPPFLLLFSHSVMFDSLWLHGVQHARLPCLSLSPGVCSNSCYCIDDAIQPSHPLLPPFPPALNVSQHHGLFQWVSSSHQVAKILALQLQHQSFQWIFRVNFL